MNLRNRSSLPIFNGCLDANIIFRHTIQELKIPDNAFRMPKAFITWKFDASFQHLRNCCLSDTSGCPKVGIFIVLSDYVPLQRPLVTAEYMVAVSLIGDGDARRGLDLCLPREICDLYLHWLQPIGSQVFVNKAVNHAYGNRVAAILGLSHMTCITQLFHKVHSDLAIPVKVKIDGDLLIPGKHMPAGAFPSRSSSNFEP